MIKFLKNKIISSISTKMMVLILSTSIIIYVFAIGYISISFKNKTLEDSKKLVDTKAKEYANFSQANMQIELDATRTMAQAFEGIKELPLERRRPFCINVLKSILIANKNFLAVWSIWEPNAIDGQDNLHTTDFPHCYNTGRFGPSFYRVNNEILSESNEDSDEEELLVEDYYKVPKKRNIETIIDPYFYSYTQSQGDEIFETSVAVPIIFDNKFAGVVGIDMELNRFEEIIKNIKPYETGYAFLLSNNGTYVAHPKLSKLGQNIVETDSLLNQDFQIIKNVQEGKCFSFIYTDNKGEELYCSFAPVAIGKTNINWSLAVVTPLNKIINESQTIFYISLIVGLVGLIALIVVVSLIAKTITKPIKKVTKVLESMSTGNIDINKKIDLQVKDEVGHMIKSVNTLIDGLNSIADFADKIGEGKLDINFKPLSDNDVLSNALLKMHHSLLLAEQEDEKRKKEDEKRNWSAQGLAMFSEILRQNNDNIKLLTFNVLQNIIQYLNANQGGIFVLNDENENNKFLELTACYAYDRQKFHEQKVLIGEGLIGTCFLEKNIIYLTEIPKSYITITSGLGSKTPKALLIVPLKFNGAVYGILEIASFNEFEQNEIEFVEKISESIASTISLVKINVRTSFLLEQSQKQAEIMKSSEEELRQNIEEMSATREELERKDIEQKRLLDKLRIEHEKSIKEINIFQEEVKKQKTEKEEALKAIKSVLVTIDYSPDGKILDASDFFLAEIGMKREDFVGKYHKDFITPEVANSYEYRKMWDELKAGNIQRRKQQYHRKDGTPVWKLETFNPIRDDYGKIIKIIDIEIDITDIVENSN